MGWNGPQTIVMNTSFVLLLFGLCVARPEIVQAAVALAFAGQSSAAEAAADLQLARADQTHLRFYSMSSQIQKEKKSYYNTLERSQRGSLDLSSWIEWYLQCLGRAVQASHTILAVVLAKESFWKRHAGESFHERQRNMLNKGLDGFEGKLTSSKWAKITKCSQDTAQRDINDLISRGILEKEPAGGRSTRYKLATCPKRHFNRSG